MTKASRQDFYSQVQAKGKYMFENLGI